MSDHPPLLIVDEHDRPIGSMSINEVYDKGMIHRVVYVVIEDGAGNILIQKRTANLVSSPNCWSISVSGHVDYGEDYLTAAERETYEELGLKNLKLVKVGRTHYREGPENKKQKRFVRLYKTRIARDTPLHFAPDEVSEVQWMTLAEIKQLIATQPDKASISLKDCMKTYY